MERVFCGDCKWYWFYEERSSGCDYPDNRKPVAIDYCPTYKTIIRGRHYKEDPEINKNNDCTWYLRKWWKFWVKP